MSADPRLPDLFAEISDLATSERRERLGELAATDPALARELAELIEAGESYPDRLVPGELAQLDGLEAIGERALPAAIGEFRILRELGRGGMGRVYLAEQETSTYRRRVALKLLESSTLDPQAVKRFRDEVRILASLEHPGIARFLDGGQTADGTWFLALEFVEGEDLVADARRRALSIDQRVRLFATVLEAVAYAHERRVIHRDLKPGNILVGADGRPKLLDFGISKLIDPGSVGDATSTRTELRAFTPAYASPEQFRGEPATPASDVYSAGVLLYELLTGVRPFGRRSGSPDAAARFERAVLEEDPEPPSTAARRATRELTTRNTWELMTKAGATGAQLSPDLDAICLKALRKDAAARYRSAAEFAGDLERYLDQRPVLAREGLRRYRLERFLHRNRRGLLTTAAFVLTLAVALTAIVVAVRGAERTHAVAVEPAPRPFPFSPAKAPKVEDAERDFVAAPQSVEAGAAYALGLQRAGRFKEAAVVVARLRQIPGRENDPLIDYVDALLATGAIQSQRALILLERALASAIAGGRGELVAQVRATRGRLLSTMGRRDEARSDMELARSAFEAAGDQTSLARVLNDLAIEAAQEGDLGKAEELFEAALAASGGNRGAALLNNLANLAMLRGRPDLAKGRFDESIPIARESGRPSRLGFALRELSLALRDLGRPGEADRALAEAFGPLRQADDKPSLARATSYRALAEIERGHFAGIEGTVRELEEVATSSGSTEPLALAEQVAGELAFAQHEFSPARRHLEEAARLIRGTSEADSVVELEVRIAEVVLAAGDPGEAVRLAEAAIAPLRGHGERSILVLGESLLVRIAAASGDLEAARRRLSTLPESAASSPSCRVRIAYLRARAAIFRRSGDSAAARQDFDAAVGVAKMAEWIETGRRLRQEAQER